MKIDLSKVLSQATQATKEAEANSDGYKLVYPQDGELKVKLLYNIKSGVVMRLVNRHMLGNSNRVVCLSQYGMDCPVCKAVDHIEGATGADLWKLKNNKRAIFYAEYLESTYKVSNDDRYNPTKGEIILMMVPYTVYAEINKILSESGENIGSFITENSGKVISITRFKENDRTTYKSGVDSFIPSHKTRETDAEFDEILTNLPNLNEKIVPVEFSEELSTKCHNAADSLEAEYLGSRVSRATEPSVSQVGSTQYTKVNGEWKASPAVTTAPASVAPAVKSAESINSSAPAGKPECFGHLEDPEPAKCIICSEEFDCKMRTEQSK